MPRGLDPDDASRWLPLLAGGMAFACFLPYPAMAIGNATAIQLGNVITAVMVLPVLMMSWSRRPFFLYPMLMMPLALSALWVAASGRGDAMVSLKTMIAWGISAIAMLAAQLWSPRYSLAMLTGMALATLLHTAVGAWQFYAFSTGGAFPMLELYENVSFLSVKENADIIARYIQRPFGLFPEPSAMTSSLAPWVLFWVAELLGLVKLRTAPAPWQRKLFALAAAGALALMLVSRSGHSALTVLALLGFVVIWLTRARATVRTSIIFTAGLGIILPAVLWAATWAMADRLGGASELGNSSWEDRANSLWLGLQLMVSGDFWTILLGMGPGMTAVAIYESARLEAVWSVILSYGYDTGIIGMLVLFGTGLYLLKTWQVAGRGVVFMGFAAVWLLGVTLTTSYEQLLPQWLALGWMTVWPMICKPGEEPASEVSEIAVRRFPRRDPGARTDQHPNPRGSQ